MKIKKVIFTIILAASFVIVIFSFKNPGSIKTTAVKPVLKDTVITGQELYRENCAGCHKVSKEGTPPKFPSLVNIKDKMSKEQVYTEIKNGKVLMHGFAYLPDNEITAITSYLFNDAEPHATVKSNSMIELGKNLVMSNCLSCHHLTVNDPAPSSAKTLCPLVEPSALVGEKKQLSKEQFFLVLKTGPCYMPSFDFLNAKDKEAIWTFLNSLREKAK